MFEGNEYRYGFQGQEQDPEIKGEGNSVNYKFRMHDPRVGRFFAVDPLAPEYPFYSPYAFSGNRVLDAVELEGLEPKSIHVYFTNKDGDITDEFHKTEQGTGHLGDYYIEGTLPSIGVKSKDFALNSNVTIIYNVDSKEVEYKYQGKVNNVVAKKKEIVAPKEDSWTDALPDWVQDGGMEGSSDPTNSGTLSEGEKKVLNFISHIVGAAAELTISLFTGVALPVGPDIQFTPEKPGISKTTDKPNDKNKDI